MQEKQNLTPAMQQYYELKSQNPEAILWFRMGDFYEMFDEDAHIAHKVLGINITTRNKNAINPQPLAWVPYHAKDKYLPQLVNAWYKVAIAEQVSDPKAKWIVQREVVRVVTPATLNLEGEAYIDNKECRLVGPNCPGVITPEEAKVGIMPGFIFKKGNIGIVSKSGTLTYEAADQVVKNGYGISTAIGIGGDPIIGTTTKDAIEMFMNDDETDAIVMIGEIGGQLEAEAARWIKENGNKKPVIGFIAGQTAPKGRTMGHAGAIVGGKDDTAQAKMAILKENGIHVVESPAKIGEKVAEILG